ncbi:hypothetical protein SynPROS71_02420 [Synechococcus sp. PROS-7-1]|nr:hypothetical protein SynPROS71_02420 [Synechococcus sp. PROS-7-1]
MKYSIAPPTASTIPTMLAQLRLALTTLRPPGNGCQLSIKQALT